MCSSLRRHTINFYIRVLSLKCLCIEGDVTQVIFSDFITPYRVTWSCDSGVHVTLCNLITRSPGDRKNTASVVRHKRSVVVTFVKKIFRVNDVRVEEFHCIRTISHKLTLMVSLTSPHYDKRLEMKHCLSCFRMQSLSNS